MSIFKKCDRIVDPPLHSEHESRVSLAKDLLHVLPAEKLYFLETRVEQLRRVEQQLPRGQRGHRHRGLDRLTQLPLGDGLRLRPGDGFAVGAGFLFAVSLNL